ncbi:MAG TPA: NAD(P)-binding domain-containing protein, partial [Candidatus Binatia bacterium]
MESKIGFIGLGTMGKPMAANIAKAGFALMVYDLRDEACKALAAMGATVASSPRQLAEESDIIEIAVVDDAQAEEVVLGEHGVLHGARPGS